MSRPFYFPKVIGPCLWALTDVHIYRITVDQTSSTTFHQVHLSVSYSRFPRLLCFMWFWFISQSKMFIMITSLHCRWQTHTTQCFMPTVLYTDVDGQCNKLVTNDRYQFITLIIHLSRQHLRW